MRNSEQYFYNEIEWGSKNNKIEMEMGFILDR